MYKKQWMPILEKIIKGAKVDYIVLQDGTKLYTQYKYQKRVFEGTKFTGRYTTETSHYWVFATPDTIHMNFPAKSKFYHCIYDGIPIQDIKFLKFK